LAIIREENQKSAESLRTIGISEKMQPLYWKES
jgi:hypothetical protein